MDNLGIYNKVRAVPQEALKTITGGRLNGKSDINPMWRIKVLTETFGVCGFGWKYEIADMRLEKGEAGEVSAFVNINLYVKVGDQWSEAIPGTGGSAFVAKETKGLYTSDECFKMALTDAISVACKALGVGADVYWDKDKTKYDKSETPKAEQPNNRTAEQPKKAEPIPVADIPKPRVTEKQADTLRSMAKEKWVDKAETLFIRYTGCSKPAYVPADMYDEVLKKIKDAPFV